jgi:hypothetical protein
MVMFFSLAQLINYIISCIIFCIILLNFLDLCYLKRNPPKSKCGVIHLSMSFIHSFKTQPGPAGRPGPGTGLG